MINKIVRFFLDNKLVAWLLLALFVGWGMVTAPFENNIDWLPKDAVSVDAIPNIGENQQIIFTKWKGRSPQDVEDQITYPLTTTLLGIPGVKSVRSNSMFGFSSIFLIFEEDVEFYWSRSRILEKLNSLPAGLLPEGVQPELGPDATALGQIFWYTLEGKDSLGNVTGGWDLQELRSVQDFYVKYGLQSASGVAEVASVGGFVKEYQVDVDPEKMKVYGIRLPQVMKAVKESNLDIGAQTIEINLAEYFVRGLGYIKKLDDLENAVVTSVKNVPVRIKDIAKVHLGPATRRGMLDKSGASAVGGVVVARYGANPLEVINNVKQKIEEISSGLPEKVLSNGVVSKLHIVPFYDRTTLIKETIGTLEEALNLEVLITVIVVILMLLNLKSSLLISASLPVAVLMCFIAMKYFGVEANIVALSGIAIAIGTMVDMGIVLSESILDHLKKAPENQPVKETVYLATIDVASAVVTAVATTIVSFLPVFTMQASEGKLFRPLAYTKTFALIASIVLTITIVPPLAEIVFKAKSKGKIAGYFTNSVLVILSLFLMFTSYAFFGVFGLLIGAGGLISTYSKEHKSERWNVQFEYVKNIIYALLVAWLLAVVWMPLGVGKSEFYNFLFIVVVVGSLIGLFYVIIYFYERILRFLIDVRYLFLLLIIGIIYLGFSIFKNTQEEFLPSLKEGAFLLMPTSMPHSGVEMNEANLRMLDMAVSSIPEVELVVGKAGRVESSLDPAPINMFENIISYKTEYKVDEQGRRLRFKVDKNGEFVRDSTGNLILDDKGKYFRQWRKHIKSENDIWNEIVKATKIPGLTSAPRLQPIEARLVMLQSGMRAPMGIKVKGSDLKTIEKVGMKLEKLLKEVKGVKKSSVFADRIVGKPYLLIDINRDAIARYGLTIENVQTQIQTAIGGMKMTSTVEGRERYDVRLRYPLELRNDPDKLKAIYVSTPKGLSIPLGELAEIKYEQGPQSIKSEDGFLIGYVLFDKEDKFSEIETVNNAREYLQSKIDDGSLKIPKGITFKFAGNYEEQVRSNKRLAIVIPIALALIFLILYFQFNSVLISLMVFSGVFVAFSGGFIMIGLYDQDWFLNFNFFGTNMRELFQVNTINLSVAVWVGFLALFGIATDDGVLVATFLQDSFKKNTPSTPEEIKKAVIEGGKRRVKPAMMTTATTILALLPVLSSSGRGAEIMLPMAIPSFGGMVLNMVTMFTVPILYFIWKDLGHKIKHNKISMKTFIHKKYLIIPFALLIAGVLSSVMQVKAQELDSLLKLATLNNPTLLALEKEYKAVLERVDQTNVLPDPKLGVGIPVLRPETRLGAQTLMLSATQVFPWFGTLKSKEDIVLALSKARLEKVVATQLEIFGTIRKAYYNLEFIEEKKRLLKEFSEIYKTLESVALAKVESGQSIISDVLRIQIKQDEIIQEIEVLKEQTKSFASVIRQLTNLPEEQPLVIVPSKELAFSYNLEEYREKIKAQHPLMQIIEAQLEASKKQQEWNQNRSNPSIIVGVDYSLVNPRTDAVPLYNGRDIFVPKVGVSIPIHRKQYIAKNKEENYKQEALAYRKTEIENKLITRLVQAESRYNQAEIKIALYQQQVEKTEKAYAVLLEHYSSSGKGFDELLQIENQLLTYKIGIEQEQKKQKEAQADILSITEF